MLLIHPLNASCYSHELCELKKTIISLPTSPMILSLLAASLSFSMQEPLFISIHESRPYTVPFSPLNPHHPVYISSFSKKAITFFSQIPSIFSLLSTPIQLHCANLLTFINSLPELTRILLAPINLSLAPTTVRHLAAKAVSYTKKASPHVASLHSVWWKT